MRVLCLILLATGVAADTTAGPKWPDCFCTDKNRDRFELGQQTCLTVDGRSFIAECQMSLNVPMWREQEGVICPVTLDAEAPQDHSVTLRIAALR